MENSKYGTVTLEVISEADNFNRWMYKVIQPFCTGYILEIGSGIGNISKFFVYDEATITLSDFNSGYFPLLKDKLGKCKNQKGILLIDFSDKYLELNHPELIGKFDTVFALNVLEHISDHVQALKNAYSLLRPGGKVIILVPAFQCLYNGFDEQLGHYRRYTAKTLNAVMKEAGFRVSHSQYFNFIAVIGWFFSGNILRKRVIPRNQMRLFDTLVPVWKVIDFFTSRVAGISLIQTGEKV